LLLLELGFSLAQTKPHQPRAGFSLPGSFCLGPDESNPRNLAQVRVFEVASADEVLLLLSLVSLRDDNE
jgi:hypothetical protein